MSLKSRRAFISTVSAAAVSAASPTIFQTSAKKTIELKRSKTQTRFDPNDQINVALIGMGIMGFSNAETSRQIPGVHLVGACDLYSGRLQRAKEVLGSELVVTKNYQELLDRSDIDAVIISTSDHWHDRIAIEAMQKGKHVYIEKPMVHHLDEGAAVIAAQKQSGKVCIVGSQRVSSIVTEKAKELYASGVIGDLILVETWMDRHSSNGAWQYAIPTDARAGTVDWEGFLGDAPKLPYDPVRFFRWRNYRDYGTGIAGDLFVHLFSALHAVTGSHGPERIYASGGLRYWKDGRDVPDICLGIYDYPQTSQHPAFNLQMRVNFVDGAELDDGLRLIGTDGVIDLGWESVKVTRHPISSRLTYGGWDSFDTFTAAQQKEYAQWHDATYPQDPPRMIEPDAEYTSPEGYSANLDHHQNFYSGIRSGQPIVEDALFGMRAAGPALASNVSLFEKKVVRWDPVQCKVL